MDQCTCLNPELFEQIKCLKYNWHGTTDNLAAVNKAEIEHIEMTGFENMEKVEELYWQALLDSRDDIGKTLPSQLALSELWPSN